MTKRRSLQEYQYRVEVFTEVWSAAILKLVLNHSCFSFSDVQSFFKFVQTQTLSSVDILPTSNNLNNFKLCRHSTNYWRSNWNAEHSTKYWRSNQNYWHLKKIKKNYDEKIIITNFKFPSEIKVLLQKRRLSILPDKPLTDAVCISTIVKMKH